MIKLLRCDDRLIHGQCMTKIVQQYDVKEIIIVDDFIASNGAMKRIFEMAVPKGMKAKIYTSENVVDQLHESLGNEISTIVLMRSPVTMLKLFQNVEDLPKEFNIASVAPGPEKIEITQYAQFSQEELVSVKEMKNMGIHIWLQLIPGTTIIEWNDIESKFN